MSMNQFETYSEVIADLLGYPGEDYFTALDALLATSSNRKCIKPLRAFRESISDLPVHGLQELYARTFDLSPVCSPALSVHLFGVESFKRSHLMVGLLDTYHKAGFAVSGEAADHMSTVMRFLSQCPADERDEICRYILLPALTKMSEFLESKSNPFAHLLSAAAAHAAAGTGKEASYA